VGGECLGKNQKKCGEKTFGGKSWRKKVWGEFFFFLSNEIFPTSSKTFPRYLPALMEEHLPVSLPPIQNKLKYEPEVQIPAHAVAAPPPAMTAAFEEPAPAAPAPAAPAPAAPAPAAPAPAAPVAAVPTPPPVEGKSKT
jgi:hypothetical protein